MRHLTDRSTLLLTSSLILPLLCGFGGHRPGTLSPVALGMGDATIAAGSGTVALVSNPAGLAHVRQHAMELGLSREPLNRTTSFYVAQADSTSPSGVAAGLSYGYHTGAAVAGITRSGSDFRAGAALGLGGETGRLYFGGSARWLDLEFAQEGKDTRTVTGWTGDLGVTLALAGKVRLGAAWRNLVVLDADETPGRLAAGAAVVFESFILSGEGSWGIDGGGLAWRGGAGLLVADTLQLRAGYSWDKNRGVNGAPVQNAHVGLGWRHEAVVMDGGLAVDLDEPSTVIFGFSMTFQLPYTLG